MSDESWCTTSRFGYTNNYLMCQVGAKVGKSITELRVKCQRPGPAGRDIYQKMGGKNTQKKEVQ